MFELKIMLSDLGIRGMDANHTSIILDVGEKSHLDPSKLISLITLEPKKYAFRNDQKFVRYLTHAESDALVETAALYLEQLKSRCFDESIQDFKG
jgi:transcription-repair coupling factor (superfamily II helicase)